MEHERVSLQHNKFLPAECFASTLHDEAGQIGQFLRSTMADITFQGSITGRIPDETPLHIHARLAEGMTKVHLSFVQLRAILLSKRIHTIRKTEHSVSDAISGDTNALQETEEVVGGSPQSYTYELQVGKRRRPGKITARGLLLARKSRAEKGDTSAKITTSDIRDAAYTFGIHVVSYNQDSNPVTITSFTRRGAREQAEQNEEAGEEWIEMQLPASLRGKHINVLFMRSVFGVSDDEGMVEIQNKNAQAIGRWLCQKFQAVNQAVTAQFALLDVNAKGDYFPSIPEEKFFGVSRFGGPEIVEHGDELMSEVKGIYASGVVQIPLLIVQKDAPVSYRSECIRNMRRLAKTAVREHKNLIILSLGHVAEETSQALYDLAEDFPGTMVACIDPKKPESVHTGVIDIIDHLAGIFAAR